ncbi:MAG: type II secretion system GspH family protein [Oscillospiraceae bacterium]|nr:type II secretion system GspH family protein [Oscillospiraceae bacterium]
MKGFTLIELIVTIAIIGVLAAILVPSMMGYVGDSKLSTANSNAKLAYTNTATYSTKCSVAGHNLDDNCSITAPSSLQRSSSDPTTVEAPTETPTSGSLLNALKALMGTESPNAGYVEVVLAPAGVPQAASWAKTQSESYVGNYPKESTAARENWAADN